MDFQSPVSIFFLCLHSIYILFVLLPAPAAASLVLQKEDVCQGVRGSLVCDDVHRLPSTAQFGCTPSPSAFPGGLSLDELWPPSNHHPAPLSAWPHINFPASPPFLLRVSLQETPLAFPLLGSLRAHIFHHQL